MSYPDFELGRPTKLDPIGVSPILTHYIIHLYHYVLFYTCQPHLSTLTYCMITVHFPGYTQWDSDLFLQQYLSDLSGVHLYLAHYHGERL